MKEPEIAALLDAHDSLVRACLDGGLSLIDVVAAYGGFPHSYALDARNCAGRALPLSLRQRVDFHAQVAGVFSGAGAPADGADDLAGDAGDFMLLVVVMMRLRQLASRHPSFKVE